MRSCSNCEVKFLRSFIFFSIGVHGLCGLILTWTGAWHMVSYQDFTHTVNPYLGWIVVITGIMLVLMAVMGLVALMKKSVTCKMIIDRFRIRQITSNSRDFL